MGRVDDWDEHEDDVRGSALRPAMEAAEVLAVAAAPPDGALERDLTWREMLRGTPIWVWLITCSSLGLIFAMCITILLLIVFWK